MFGIKKNWFHLQKKKYYVSATAKQTKQKMQRDKIQSLEILYSYSTDDVWLKQMSYILSLVPMGLEKENFCFGAVEDTENEAEDEEDEDY